MSFLGAGLKVDGSSTGLDGFCSLCPPKKTHLFFQEATYVQETNLNLVGVGPFARLYPHTHVAMPTRGPYTYKRKLEPVLPKVPSVSGREASPLARFGSRQGIETEFCRRPFRLPILVQSFGRGCNT